MEDIGLCSYPQQSIVCSNNRITVGAGGHWTVVSLSSQQSAATRVELQGSGSGQRNGASLVPRGDVGMLTC